MTTPIPPEFVGFVRETGVKAFDRLASRAKELDPPLRTFLRSWSRFSTDQKNALFDELIAARMPEAAPDEPPPGMKQKRPVRRYDPEEVAATLPRKPAPRKKAKKKSK